MRFKKINHFRLLFFMFSYFSMLTPACRPAASDNSLKAIGHEPTGLSAIEETQYENYLRFYGYNLSAREFSNWKSKIMFNPVFDIPSSLSDLDLKILRVFANSDSFRRHILGIGLNLENQTTQARYLYRRLTISLEALPLSHRVKNKAVFLHLPKTSIFDGGQVAIKSKVVTLGDASGGYFSQSGLDFVELPPGHLRNSMIRDISLFSQNNISLIVLLESSTFVPTSQRIDSATGARIIKAQVVENFSCGS